MIKKNDVEKHCRKIIKKVVYEVLKKLLLNYKNFLIALTIASEYF